MIIAVDIPGKYNVVTDREFQVDEHDMKWQLNQSVFQRINLIFGPI